MEDQKQQQQQGSNNNNANGPLETTRAERAVWLMKCPPLVAKSLKPDASSTSASASSPSDQQSSRPVAKVVLSIDPLNSNDDSSSPQFTMELAATESGNMPKCYSLDMSKDFIPMSVFSELSQGKLSVEGKILNKFDMKPHNENLENYGKLCRERTKKYMKNRKIQVIDNDNGAHMRPMPGMIGFIAPGPSEKKKNANKGVRHEKNKRDRGEMEAIMFKLFERQPNWTLRQLIQETDQPEQFLKDILKELCVYNNKGANQGTLPFAKPLSRLLFSTLGMDSFFKVANEDCVPSELDILRCPFLRNINEPTNFSFASSLAFPVPGRGGKGPIFEDGPNFDMAFRLFHGSDGVVPLSGRSFVHSNIVEPQPAPSMFNPLAAKAATISLSSFGGPFSFDAFSEKWKNQKRKSNSSKKDSSSKGGNSNHEALSNEWLQSGSCPIAKSYRAVSGVIPLVAKAFQPPPGMKIKCPPAIVAARAALARTAFAKNLRPQPLPEKVLVIGALGMAANVPLGVWREHTKKFSPSWFAAVHAAVPFIAILRKSVLMPKSAMAFTIAASVLGQVIGSRAERYRLKAVTAKKLSLTETPFGGTSELQVLKAKTGHCNDIEEWNSVALQVTRPSSSTDVFC
ncbi:hypothetical protein Pyn_11934 [Prunus yedoensis var. nudiflora]|uniref:TFIIF beta subunit HTH domain-containing protein n=1 Tax=Prunus yedoensis var. nudiflora TaxID=2094558 RepID=A0A314Y4Q1_PRUYE|nr:hypothetical protein Pyn_11934 [Prunus yedoensis var. nudiflora]